MRYIVPLAAIAAGTFGGIMWFVRDRLEKRRQDRNWREIERQREVRQLLGETEE